MKSAQSIMVPFGDTRIIEWDIDLPDETPDDPDDNLPLDLSGKPVRWVLRRTPRSEPVIEYNSAVDDALRIDDPEQEIVSLRLDSTETTIGLDGGTYRLHIENPASGDGWTVAEGSFTISR